MSPSGIICGLIFTGCLMAGASSGEWVTGAFVGVGLCALFLFVMGWDK